MEIKDLIFVIVAVLVAVLAYKLFVYLFPIIAILVIAFFIYIFFSQRYNY